MSFVKSFVRICVHRCKSQFLWLWWVAVAIDRYSRKAIGFAVFKKMKVHFAARHPHLPRVKLNREA